MPHNLNVDFKLTSEAKIQPVFTGREDMPVAFDFSHQGHALVTLYVQFLCSDWSKFDRWVHAENLCSILKLVFFDSWGWLSFVSTCDVFNCLFPLNVQNEIQLLSRVFCYSWLVCLLGFWLRNTFFFRALMLTDQMLTQHVTLIACYFEPVGLVLWISCFYM